MKKRMLIMIACLIIVFGGVFGWDAIRAYFMAEYFANYQAPPITISTVKAKTIPWYKTYKSVGTLIAVNGVTISSEVAGLVTDIDFKSGEMVKKGQLLVKLDDRVEQAELKNNKAALELAKLEYERNFNLLKRKAVSESTFDKAKATLQQDQASVEKVQATIAQKTITAPFDGRLGIREVNLGQYISPGAAMVTLQAIRPIFINFYLPEQDLPYLFKGQKVTAHVDTYPNEIFDGKITAISSLVDINTHNILVQATFPNKAKKLYPGLFANVEVISPNKQEVTVLPTTAVTFSLFGDSVFVIEPPKKPEKTKSGQPIYMAKQVFVKTGDQTKDQVIIKSGIKPGQEVVSSGQLKLENDTRVIINNSIQLTKKQNEIY